MFSTKSILYIYNGVVDEEGKIWCVGPIFFGVKNKAVQNDFFVIALFFLATRTLMTFFSFNDGAFQERLCSGRLMV